MSYSKRQYINAAFEEIGLASYVFDLQPEQLESALKRLDSMMADWNGKGIRLSYPIPGEPEYSNIDAPTQVPDSANEAIITNLAIRIAPSYGRQVMPDTKSSARGSYQTLLSRAAMPPEQQLSMLPSGAGNKYWRNSLNPFTPRPEELLLAGEDGEFDFN